MDNRAHKDRDPQTTIYAVATPDGTTYWDTRHEAETTANNINAANRTKYPRHQVADIAVAYAIDVEPEVRGAGYWERDETTGEAAA